MSISLFRRALVAIVGAVCLVLATAAFGPLASASADPPPQAQNDGNGNSDSPGPGHGSGSGQDNASGANGGGQRNGGANAGGNDGHRGNSGSNAGRQGTRGGPPGGSSDSNPDGGGLDKPDCEGTAEGCQGLAPRDGNNGCGNEAEPKSVRDDDNDGNCGGGQEKESDAACDRHSHTQGLGHDGEGPGHEGDCTAEGTVAAAGAQAAWTGDPARAIAAVAGAALKSARAWEAATGRAGNSRVLGVSVERAAAGEQDVNLEDLELARQHSSRSGERSLLALTGMAMVTLLAVGLFVIGLGRLLRGVEGDGS